MDTTGKKNEPPTLLTEKEAASYLGTSPQFLRQSRHYGNRPGHAEGPPYIRVGGGRLIRYMASDLEEWLRAHRCYPTPLPDQGNQKQNHAFVPHKTSP